jgi:hypothetical protein
VRTERLAFLSVVGLAHLLKEWPAVAVAALYIAPGRGNGGLATENQREEAA